MKRAQLSLALVPKPRALVISSSTHALIFRPSDRPSVREVIVEFTDLGDPDSAARTQTGIRLATCWGCLGLLDIDRDIFVVIVSHATTIGTLQPSHEPIHRVLSVELFCLTSAAFDYQHLAYHSASPGISPALDPEELPPLDHPALNGIKKIVSNGQFYFSGTNTDLSSRAEHRLMGEDRAEEDTGRFSWNSFMLFGLTGFKDGLSTEARLHFDRQSFLVSVIQGYVASYELKLPPPPLSVPVNGLPPDQLSQPISFSISLFSRLGSRRAGTRFNTRGIDDDGNVANFVETETLIVADSNLFSFVQIRGSVPLFFEQAGTGMTNVIGGLSGQGHRTQLTRNGVATQPAFDRHFEDLLQQYSMVQIVNLLSSSRESELQLSQAYHERLNAFGRENVQMTHFDLHQRSKIAGLDGVRAQLMNDPSIGGMIEPTGNFLATVSLEDGEAKIVERQKGVFRTNCLDCLDRTNVVQEMLSRMAVEKFLSLNHPHLLRSEYLWNCHRTLWADNGDVLSKIYAGTGALNTSYTRGGKQTFSGMLSNASKSVGRMYNSNFIDKSKQAYIDLLLGHLHEQKPVKVYDPINDTVQRSLHNRRSEYSNTVPITIWVGTYNLNGRNPPMANSDELMSWFWPASNSDPDIMVVAFQEIVKLSPQQIMVTDPEKKRRWERTILTTLESQVDKKSDYVILRSDQLVGTALIVLVKSEMVNAIRSVEAKTKKTGLKGIAGNKGAVAIRLEFHDTSFCFVTAHFAAGHANVEDRNHDYETIANELSFLKGKTIASHENVIWAGDFNYRIGGGLTNSAVRQAVCDEDFMTLLAADQLLAYMGTQSVFPRYLEGPITFAPTYKYDIGTDRYDTSEKMRIPAWTDRILYQGNDLDLTHYSRTELKASDHRPVYAILRAKVRVVDRVKKEMIKQEVLRSPEVNSVREAVLMPVEPVGSPSSDAIPLDEWWKTPEYPDGTYEPTAAELASVTGQSSNPFHPSYMNSADGSKRAGSEPKLGVNRLSIRTLDRSPSASAPPSPPPAAVRSLPPAIPARPGSRSPSQTHKIKAEPSPTPVPVVKKQPPPPPPPRPRPSKESTTTASTTMTTAVVVVGETESSNTSITTSSVSGSTPPPPIPPKPKPPKPALKPKPTILNKQPSRELQAPGTKC